MTAASALALLRRFWPAIPIVGLLVWLGITRAQLADTRQTLTNERSAWTASVDRADRQRAEQERGFATSIATALGNQAERLAAREPIILHSTNTVREYAETDAGRARCLGADRVRGLDAFHAALAGADPGTAGGSAEAVHTDPDPAPAGR